MARKPRQQQIQPKPPQQETSRWQKFVADPWPSLGAIFAGLAALITGIVGYYTVMPQMEGVRFSTTTVPDFKLGERGELNFTATFYLSNTANVDLTLTRLSCTNLQLNWLQWIHRHCEITSGMETMPLTIKAGSTHVLKAEIGIEPAEEAKKIVKKAVQDGKKGVFQIGLAIAEKQMDVYGRPMLYQGDGTVGLSMSGGRELGLSDLFEVSPQGYVFTLETGRGSEFESPHFGIYYPTPGGF